MERSVPAGGMGTLTGGILLVPLTEICKLGSSFIAKFKVVTSIA